MKGILLGSFFVFLTSLAFGQITGDFRSFQTGDWNQTTSWARFNGTVWVNPAPSTPTNLDGAITIQNAHIITVTASVTIDQTVVQSGGTLTINPTFTLTLNNGSSNEITVDAGGTINVNGIILFGGFPNRIVLINGSLNNNGTLSGAAASKLFFGSGSNYFHNFTNGGIVPAATWNANATVNIVGYTSLNSTPPSGLNQTFGHFVWNAPGQDVPISLGGLPTALNGDFRVQNTGIDALYYSLGGAGNTTMNIGGNLDVLGGALGWTSGDAAGSTLNISGSLNVSAGYFQIADNQNVNINLAGNFALSGTGQIDFSASTGITNLNIQGNYTHSAGDIFVNGGTGNVNFTGASIKIFTSTIVPLGNVNFSVAASSTLAITGTNFIGGGGTFNLAGTLQVGSTDLGGALQTGTANGNIRIPTANRTYQSGSTIVYNGLASQFIGNGFPSGGDVNLTINNISNVSLSDNLDIVALRALTLTSGNIVIGAQTLTINGIISGSGGLVGGATSNLVIGGTGNFGTLTFSGTNQLNNFTLNRTSSGQVTLGGNLTILGTFTHTAGTLAIAGNTFTISGAYSPATPDDLSVTNLSSIVIDGSGALPSDVGFAGTTLGTLTLNRASTTLATTSSITINNLNLTSGTFSNGSGIAIGTGGTITRTGGTMTTNPTNTTNSYNVVYTAGTISTGPELPTSTTALANLSKTGSGTLTLASAITVNGILTLSSGSFVAGLNAIDFKGNFVSNAASTLTSSPVTFSGTTTISGGSTPTFGTITISGTLTPSANLQINGNLVNNGVLNAGTGTTTFGGTTAITGSSTSSFNNVVINGALTGDSGSINVAGNFTFTSGTFNSNSGRINFNGTSSIVGGALFSFHHITITGTLNGPSSVNLTGNFTDNGTFNRGTGNVNFIGTNTQLIGGTTLTNFNDITITNSSGPPSVQVITNKNLRGVLTLSTNTIFDPDGSLGTTVFTLVSSGDVFIPGVINDAAIASLPSGAVVNGNVTVQRYVAIEGANSGRVYRFISSPIANTPVTQVSDNLPIGGTFTGFNHAGTQSMFAYNEAVITDQNGNGLDINDGYFDFPSVADSELMQNGRGYAIFVFGNEVPFTSNGNALWDVRGTINSGEVIFNSFTSFTTSANTSTDGYNLVGNPYPSTIDWDAASGWTKTGLANAIYMRDNGVTSPIYATYINGAQVNGGSRYIPIGQAFQVRAISTTIDFRATESVKVAGQQATYFREMGNDGIRVALSNGVLRDEMLVRFTEQATAGFDSNWDAFKFPNDILNLSSNSESGEKYAINSLPLLTCGKTIKLSINDVQTGSHSLNFTEFETLSAELGIELFDSFTGGTINIRNESSYTFDVTADSASFGDKRFELRFKTSDLGNYNVFGEDICESGQAILKVDKSKEGVLYRVMMNGSSLTDWYVGTGQELPLILSSNLLTLGENVLTVQASISNCDAVFYDKVVNVSVIGIPEIVDIKSGTSCGSGRVTLSASGATEGNYKWYEKEVGDQPISGISSSTFITPELDKTRTYYVSSINALGCEGQRKPVVASIQYMDGVVINEDLSANSLTSSYDTGNQWYFNGDAIEGGTGKTIAFDQSGIYEVVVSVGECTARASKEMVISGAEGGRQNGIKIYPNPVKDYLTIEIPGTGLISGEILNASGQTITSLQFQSAGDKSVSEYDFSKAAPGLYLIIIVKGNTIIKHKIVKK